MKKTGFLPLLLAPLLGWPSLPAAAQATRKPTVILFVGNSFFHGAFEPVLSYNSQAVTDENYRPTPQTNRTM